MVGATGLSMTAAEFEVLYDRHSRAVWAVAYARHLRADLALDITQEAFCRLWKQAQAGEEIRHPRAWLVRVARNLAEDHAKSAFHRNGTHAPEALAGLRALTATPLERAVAREEQAEVRRWLADLPPADREILTLRYALDYDTDAIADALHLSAAAVHMRLSRARQRLAERLAPAGGGPDHDYARRTPRPRR
jgi:RNA polymerase sigma-70 factor (ECF subfamily)